MEFKKEGGSDGLQAPEKSERPIWVVDLSEGWGSRELHELMQRAEQENAKVVFLDTF